MINSRLINYLNDKKVHFDTLHHDVAFTAQETAAAVHIPGKALGKTVMVKLDGKLAIVLMPAHSTINLQTLRDLTGTESVTIASENDFRDCFAECELGAMPPLGDLYNLPLYVSNRLQTDQAIVFNGGSHSDLIRLAWTDYLKIAHPTVLDL